MPNGHALWGWSSRLHASGHSRLARIVKSVNFVLFNASLPPEARMSDVPHLMHYGLGVVIHPTTEFGSGVVMAHHVTVAASPVDAEGVIHPVIFGDDVFVGTGAIFIARSAPLHIGSRAVVGAGSVVLDDVPPGARVFGNPARPPKQRRGV